MNTYTYKLLVTVKGINSTFNYTIKLTDNEENNPKQKLEQERDQIRATLQQHTERRLNKEHLDLIIQTWVQDIKEGFRETILDLNLPLLTDEDLDNLIEDGIQELPELVEPNISDIEPTIGVLPPLNF